MTEPMTATRIKEIGRMLRSRNELPMRVGQEMLQEIHRLRDERDQWRSQAEAVEEELKDLLTQADALKETAQTVRVRLGWKETPSI